MSIVYGNFSQPLQKTATSGYVNGNTDIYFTIPWYPASYVERIRIFSSTSSAINVSSITILSNGAHSRVSSNAVDDFIYYDATTYQVAAATDYSAYYTINPPLYYQELYCRPYLYVKVTLATNTTADYYFCTAVGRKAYTDNSYVRNDITGVEKLSDYRVLAGRNQTGTGGTGGQIYDVSGIAIKNGGNNSTHFGFGSTNDYIYAGSSKKVDHWEFVVGVASTNAGALNAQYWNGTDWTSVTALDNTSSDGTNSMRFSGITEALGIGSSSWVKTKLDFSVNAKLPNDPATVYENGIIAGTIRPGNFFGNPERYWMRFSLASIGDTVALGSLLPISESYI